MVSTSYFDISISNCVDMLQNWILAREVALIVWLDLDFSANF